MSRRIAAALILLFVVATPTFAAAQKQSRTTPAASISQRVVKFIRAVGGMVSNYEIAIPIPKQGG